MSRIPGKETSWGIVTKFCMSVDIHDIITSVTFCDDRLWGLGVARGRNSSFPIDLRRRSYNTLELPCECVILKVSNFNHSAHIKVSQNFKVGHVTKATILWGQFFIHQQRVSDNVFSHKISQNFEHLYPFKSYGGVQNFKFGSRARDHAEFRGQFVMLWLEHVVLDECTKYAVSIFSSSKNIKEVTKFRNWSRDLSHAHSGSTFH